MTVCFQRCLNFVDVKKDLTTKIGITALFIIVKNGRAQGTDGTTEPLKSDVGEYLTLQRNVLSILLKIGGKTTLHII